MALADDLHSIEDQLNKAKTEVTGKIEALEGALANSGEQTQEVADAVAALKAVSQGLDDVVVDAAPAEAVVVEAPAEAVEVDAAPAEAVEAVVAVEAAVEAVGALGSDVEAVVAVESVEAPAAE